MSNNVTVQLHIRRFDLFENPKVEEKSVELDKDLDYNALKDEFQTICDLKENDNKVIKIRNADLALIPLMSVLEDNTKNKPIIVDVSKVNYKGENSSIPLQGAYLDAVHKTIQSMESRISEAEQLIPQLQWRRQAHMEQTVNSMSSRISFLNRRIDELMPPQWKSKMPQTAS